MAKKITVTSQFDVYNSVNELKSEEKKLFLNAQEAMEKAYAPYSNFFVGAAVLLKNGNIITGNNQENAAYPSGLCAERVAIFHASSQYPNIKILAIAVAAKAKNKPVNRRDSDSPLSPCGACRQAMMEYELKFNSSIKFIMGTETGHIYISKSISNLLPLSFSNKNL